MFRLKHVLRIFHVSKVLAFRDARIQASSCNAASTSPSSTLCYYVLVSLARGSVCVRPQCVCVCDRVKFHDQIAALEIHSSNEPCTI